VPDDLEPITPEVSEVAEAVTPAIDTDYPRNLSFREQYMRQWPLADIERRDEE
jgi:hypothetical protein